VADWKPISTIGGKWPATPGMCPREDSSAQRRFQGAISKHGNPPRAHRPGGSRLAPGAIPVPVQARGQVAADAGQSKTTRTKRKQIMWPSADSFSVDWWRVRTRRCKRADLGLQTNPTPPTVAPTREPGKPRPPRTPKPQPKSQRRMNTREDQRKETMSFPLWTLACGVIPQTKGLSQTVMRQLDPSATKGDSGAQMHNCRIEPYPRAAPQS